MTPIIAKLVQETKEYEILPDRVRDSHINKRKRLMGDSVFTYREQTVIRENRTLIGSNSVLPQKNTIKNQKTQSSRGFCSLFGFGGGSKKSKEEEKKKK